MPPPSATAEPGVLLNVVGLKHMPGGELSMLGSVSGGILFSPSHARLTVRVLLPAFLVLRLLMAYSVMPSSMNSQKA